MTHPGTDIGGGQPEFGEEQPDVLAQVLVGDSGYLRGRTIPNPSLPISQPIMSAVSG